MQAGDLYIPIRIQGAEKAVEALTKVNTSVTQVGRSVRDVIEVGGGSIDNVIGAAESGVSAIAGMLGPVGSVVTGLAAAGVAMYKFFATTGDVALEFHSLEHLTTFPEQLAAKYEYAAQSVGASAGDMEHAIQGIAHVSANAMMYGNLPPELLQLQRFSGRPLTKETVQDPKQLLEYVIGAIQSPNNKLNPIIKSELLSKFLPGLNPKALSAILEGNPWNEALAKAPKLKREDIDEETKFRRSQLQGAVDVKAWFQRAGGFTVSTMNATAKTINILKENPNHAFKDSDEAHPEKWLGTGRDIHGNPINKTIDGNPINKTIPGKLNLLNKGFKLNEKNIVNVPDKNIASNTTNNTEGNKTSNVYLTAPSADHKKVADEVVSRVASLFSAQGQMT